MLVSARMADCTAMISVTIENVLRDLAYRLTGRFSDIAGPKQRRTRACTIANKRGLSCGKSCVFVSVRITGCTANISVTVTLVRVRVLGGVFGR